MKTDRREMLLSQKNVKKFSRLDIIVRKALLDSIGTDEYSFHRTLYNKMQHLRTGHSTHTNGMPWLEQFLLLDRSFLKNGYLEKYPLIVNDQMHLINSSHRAALCLHHNINEIPVKVVSDWRPHLENTGVKSKTYFDYGIEWFSGNGFTEAEIQIIEESKKKTFDEVNLFFYAILWPPAKDCFSEIKEHIKNNYEIMSERTIDLKNNFDSIVEEVYKIDNIEDWKLEKKIKSMKESTTSREVMILKIDLFSSKFRKKTNFPECEIAIDAERIKSEVRDNYRDKVNKYFYDIIIHMSDNYLHVDHIRNVFRKYKIEN